MNKQEAIEKYEVLSECLTQVEAMVRRFSRNQAMISPRPGYEAAWAEEKKKQQVLQNMMREIREGDWE